MRNGLSIENAPGRIPKLSAVVIHWRNEAEIEALLDHWPHDPQLELIVVDNSASLSEPEGSSADGADEASLRRLRPERNLGFGGGANLGMRHARGEWVLILNPDVVPTQGALDALLEACDQYPDAVGLAPALINDDGSSQCRWQLQPLPSAPGLILQTLFLGGRRGPKSEPEAGTPVQQPAAAALALRRRSVLSVGGFDECFFPAWFEDVDLAKRLANEGGIMRYVPEARFVHATGGSVPALGYGPFLWIYYRNLEIYLRRHHHPAWILLTRLTLPLAMIARLALLPLRKPNRANSKKAAALGLVAVLFGSLSGWRRPWLWSERFKARLADEG